MMKSDFKKELKRQLFHLTGLLALPLALLIGKTFVGIGGLGLALLACCLAEYYKKREEFKEKAGPSRPVLEKMEDLFYGALNSVERRANLEKQPYVNAFSFNLGVGLTFLLLPLEIASLSVVAFVVGDSAATLVGISWGRHRLPFVRKKSWEGSLGCLLSSSLACGVLSFFIEIPLPLIPVAAFGGTLTEAFSGQLDDNLTMPLVVGLLLFLCSRYFF